LAEKYKYIKYIIEWENAEVAQTRSGEHGVAHICLDDLLQGEENERQKNAVGEYIYAALRAQAKLKY
jgi:hypothetical protein